MKNILILNAGTRDTLIQNFLKTVDGRCNIITTDSYELAPALYETTKQYVTKKWDEPGYWEDIEDICVKENIGLIASLVDPELELLANHKKRFEKKGILVNIGDEATVKAAFDKYQTLCFIKEHGFNWIKTYIDYESVEDEILNGSLTFPLITKPRKGSGSAGIEVVYNLDRLKQICEDNEDILIQEYIDGQEMGVDVYVDLLSGDVVSIFAKKKLKMRAGETDKSVSFRDEALFEMITLFAKEFGLKGVNDIDVFEKNGKYYISEVNPRFGGGYVHAYAAGVDFPALLINNMNGIVNKVQIGTYKENLYMMKYFSIKVVEKEELK